MKIITINNTIIIDDKIHIDTDIALDKLFSKIIDQIPDEASIEIDLSDCNNAIAITLFSVAEFTEKYLDGDVTVMIDGKRANSILSLAGIFQTLTASTEAAKARNLLKLLTSL